MAKIIEIERAQETPKVEKDPLMEAWETMKVVLPEEVVLAVEGIAVDIGVAPWQLVLGHVLKAWHSADLASPMIHPNWRNLSRDWFDRKGVCEFCKKEFERKVPGARFCSNECGMKFERRRIAELVARGEL